MIRLWNAARTRLGMGSDVGSRPPLIVGYRRAVPRGLVIMGALALVILLFAYGFYFGILAPARMMPFAIAPSILMALVIWGLPAGAIAPTRAIEPLFMVFFISLMLWPNYLAIGLPSLPWITMLRLFGVPLILVLLACISVSREFRQKLTAVLNADRATWQLLVIFIVLQRNLRQAVLLHR